MANIYIKGKREPVQLENKRAVNLKAKWIDPSTPRTDVVDLGDWAGEYGNIRSIEIEEKVSRYKNKEAYKDWDDFCKVFYKKTAVEKARYWKKKFRFTYCLRIKDLQADLTKEQYRKWEDVSLKYYTKYPNAVHVPNEVYEKAGLLRPKDLTAKNSLTELAESKAIKTEDDVPIYPQ